MQSIEQRYQHDYQEHESTRLENDRNLLPKLEEIRNGKDIDSLERFAKGYLGMYLDMDNTIPPGQRISILANQQLAGAIESGFRAILNEYRFPEPAEIAASMLVEEPQPVGYILLAALDLFSEETAFQVDSLSEATIIAAVCFHYSCKTEMQDRWLGKVLRLRQTEVADALSAFWRYLAEHNTDHLPGLYEIFSHSQHNVITSRVVLPVLESWKTCRKKTLRDVLHTALRVADHRQLLTICENALDEWNPAEPARYILWLSTCFLLAPGKYDMVLSDYAGRSKEKILPLMDFVVMVLLTDDEQKLPLTADAYALLLRIIAPKITPQEDRYGDLCENTQKVMYLFYRLATADDEDTLATIKRLSLVRVMKLYKEILGYVRDTQTRHAGGEKIEYEQFVAELVSGEKIKARIKWSDVGHKH